MPTDHTGSAHRVVVQVSDTHLSHSHGYFYDNWTVFLAEMGDHPPDLLIHTGDVSFNGPDAPEDLVFARDEMNRLTIPWRAIPGNHDVGEPGENSRLDQPINATRRSLWASYFGAECFVEDLPHWRLIGLNSELLGSGLTAEAEQWEMLEAALAGAGDRSVALFLHKPLFLQDPAETGQRGACMFPEPRRRLLGLVECYRVRVVASGHLHQYRRLSLGATELVWAPATAFILAEHRREPVSVHRLGYLRWHFGSDDYHVELVRPRLFMDIDVGNWTERDGTTTTMPPRPLGMR